MSTLVATLTGTGAGAIVAAVLTYLTLRRTHSGTIRTSEAGQLWDTLIGTVDRVENQRDRLIELQRTEVTTALVAVNDSLRAILERLDDVVPPPTTRPNIPRPRG